MDMVGTKVDAAERYTVRNLRIREDTAKYLRNLDPNSAHYDPKTRSMRKNPYEGGNSIGFFCPEKRPQFWPENLPEVPFENDQGF